MRAAKFNWYTPFFSEPITLSEENREDEARQWSESEASKKKGLLLQNETIRTKRPPVQRNGPSEKNFFLVIKEGMTGFRKGMNLTEYLPCTGYLPQYFTEFLTQSGIMSFYRELH